MVVAEKTKTQRYALITVHTESDKTFRIPVKDEDDGWNQDGASFDDSQMVEDHGEDISISQVVMEDSVEDDDPGGEDDGDDDDGDDDDDYVEDRYDFDDDDEEFDEDED